MTLRRHKQPTTTPLEAIFFNDRRDRQPGTHFAAELGGSRKKEKPRTDDPHVDEDLGCSEFGIDLPFLKRY